MVRTGSFPLKGGTDYKTVLELMNQYLPVTQFAGKTIIPKMLRKLRLLENSPLENLLQKCLAGDEMTSQPDSTAEI